MTWSPESRAPWENDRGGTVKGILLGLSGVVILAGLFTGYWWIAQQRGQFDQVTHCPLSGPLAVHVLLFDRSDPITPQQAQRVRQELAPIHNADRGERVDVYVLNGDTRNVLEPVFSACSPGQGKDANELYENPRMIQKRFEEEFAGLLDRTIDDLLKASTRRTSPILESLRAAAITSFGTLESGKIPLRMTIVSDMIQNTEANSHIRGETNFNALSRSVEWRSLQPDLKGADVEIWYVLRNTARRRGGGTVQNRGHQSFWEQAIAAGNGRVTRLESL